MLSSGLFVPVSILSDLKFRSYESWLQQQQEEGQGAKMTQDFGDFKHEVEENEIGEKATDKSGSTTDDDDIKFETNVDNAAIEQNKNCTDLADDKSLQKSKLVRMKLLVEEIEAEVDFLLVVLWSGLLVREDE